MDTITSNNPEIRLQIKTDYQYKSLDETKLDAIKPVEIARAFQAVANDIIGSTVYLMSVNGRPSGDPTKIEPTLASSKIGDGYVAITRESIGEYRLTIKRVVSAECYHNGSVAHSYNAVYGVDGWEKVGR